MKLLQTYSDAGYNVRFVGMDRRRRRPRVHDINGFRCEYIMAGWGYANWRLLFGYPLWVLRLLRYILTTQTELVHAFELDSALPVAIASWCRRIPFIYDVQDNYDLRHSWPFPLKPMFRLLDRWVIGRSRGVIVPDENRIVGPFKRFRDKIAIIPNCPPDLSCPDSAPARDATFTVLAMGQLAQRRGIDLLLEAVRHLGHIRLLMAGRFVEPWLEAKALAMRQVEFRGWIPSETAIRLPYEADLVFAFYDPSYAVNILANAQKWFDAMMTGTPVLANREIANASWIEREGFGYVCRYGDVAELANLLKWIGENLPDAERKGRRARKLFEERYNWPLMEKKLLTMVAIALQQ